MELETIRQKLSEANGSPSLFPEPFTVGTLEPSGLTFKVIPVHVTTANMNAENLKKFFSAEDASSILNEGVKSERYFIHVYAQVKLSDTLRKVVETLVAYIKPVFDALGAMGRVAGLIIRTESGFAHTILGPTASSYWWLASDQKSAHCGPTVTYNNFGIPSGFNGPASCTTNQQRKFPADHIPELIHSQLTNHSTDASPWMTSGEVDAVFKEAREKNKTIWGDAFKRTQTITDLARVWLTKRTGGRIPEMAKELLLYKGTISRKRRSHRKRRPSKKSNRRTSRHRSRRSSRRR